MMIRTAQNIGTLHAMHACRTLGLGPKLTRPLHLQNHAGSEDQVG